MKVGSLFAEIGFKVDESGLEKFSNAMKALQKTIHESLEELKEYAKVAKGISQSVRGGGSGGSGKTAIERNADAYLKAQRARFFEQDSETRKKNADARLRQLDLKERGLIGTHNGKATESLKKVLSFVGGLASGKLFTAIGSVFGTIPALIGRIADSIISGIWKAATWLGKTFLQGIKFGLAYRDYRAFTGRSTKNLTDLMYASLGTTNMRPEDIMKDAAAFEKGYWDMFLGGGNPRAWQMLGLRPTGISDVDLRNVIGAISNIPQKGLQRKMLEEFGLSEDYLVLLEELQKKSPEQTFSDLMDEVENSIDAYSEANKQIRLFSFKLEAAKSTIVRAFEESDLPKVLEKLGPLINTTLVRGFELLGKTLPPLVEKLNLWLAEKLGMISPEDQDRLNKIRTAKSFANAERRIMEREEAAGPFKWLMKYNPGLWFANGSMSYIPHIFNMLTSPNKKDYLNAATYNITVNSVEEADKLISRLKAEEMKIYNKYMGTDNNTASAGVDTAF